MDGMTRSSVGIFTATVNGRITVSDQTSARSFYRPMLADILARIEQRLEALKLDATKASRNAGLSVDAIRNMRRAVAAGDRKGVSTRTIAALAEALGTSQTWLLTGEGEQEVEPAERIEVVGVVGQTLDGKVSAAPPNLRQVPALPGATSSAMAILVSQQLSEFADEGAILYFDEPVASPPPTTMDGVFLIKLSDDELLVARLLRGSEDGLYDIAPFIGSKKRDAEIEWAAELIGHLSARQVGRTVQRHN